MLIMFGCCKMVNRNPLMLIMNGRSQNPLMLVMLGCSLARLQEGEPQPTDADHVRLPSGRVKPEPADAGDARLLGGSLKILQNGENLNRLMLILAVVWAGEATTR